MKEETVRLKISVNKNGIYPIPNNAFQDLNFKTNYILYIIKKGSTFIYVGITTQKIQKRFSDSFYAYKNQNDKKKFNGYSGYKWIEDSIKSKAKLTLFLMPIGEGKTAGLSKSKKLERKRYAEAIEAELVFAIRLELGSWPKYQHEIHFHNLKGAKKIAEGIYKKSV